MASDDAGICSDRAHGQKHGGDVEHVPLPRVDPVDDGALRVDASAEWNPLSGPHQLADLVHRVPVIAGLPGREDATLFGGESDESRVHADTVTESPRESLWLSTAAVAVPSRRRT